MKYKLEAQQLTLARASEVIFTGLSFALAAHEGLLVQGENGAGKTSLLRMLAGLITPSGGDIFWQNKTIAKQTTIYQEMLHYLGHRNGLKLQLTVAENLQLNGKLALQTIADTEILQTLRLEHKKNQLVHTLSAGEKRKVALAKLFLIPRPLWLLDEPLTALDANSQQFFLTQLGLHLRHGGMAIMATHQPIMLPQQALKILQLPLC